MNSLLAADGRKLNSGAGGFGGGISSRVFSSCFLRASLAVAWRLAGESPLLPEEDPFSPTPDVCRRRTGDQLTRQPHPLIIIILILIGDSLSTVTDTDRGHDN